MPSKTAASTASTPPSAEPRWKAAREWLGTVLRLLLAGVWVYAGLSKIGDPAASVRAVRAYRLLPEWLAKGTGYGLPFVEIALGVLLLVGLATRLSAAVSAVLLVVFLTGMASAAARGLRIECGCFGGGGQLAGGASTHYTGEILRDVGLLVAASLLVVWPRSRLAADDTIRASVPGAEAVRVGPRRTKAAQERLAELVEQRRRQGERRVRVYAAASVVLLLAVAGAGIGIQSARVRQPAGPTPEAVSVQDGVVVGKASAKVTVDLYEDLQCPVCKQFESSAGPVLAQYVDAGKVKARYYVISFLNQESSTLYSSRAANAAYCAADAGVFQKFIDVAFPNQPPEGSAGLTDDQLIALGRQAGATSPTFAQCVRTRKYNSFVNDITDTSSRDGISGTPTVLVNNAQVQGLTGDALRSAIESALGT